MTMPALTVTVCSFALGHSRAMPLALAVHSKDRITGRAVTVGCGARTFALSPTVVPGGFGLSFTRIGAE